MAENGYKYSYFTYPEKFVRKYFAREHDAEYRANADGRTRKEWARDKAFDDYICRGL